MSFVGGDVVCFRATISSGQRGSWHSARVDRQDGSNPLVCGVVQPTASPATVDVNTSSSQDDAFCHWARFVEDQHLSAAAFSDLQLLVSGLQGLGDGNLKQT